MGEGGEDDGRRSTGKVGRQCHKCISPLERSDWCLNRWHNGRAMDQRRLLFAGLFLCEMAVGEQDNAVKNGTDEDRAEEQPREGSAHVLARSRMDLAHDSGWKG